MLAHMGGLNKCDTCPLSVIHVHSHLPCLVWKEF